ncbi:hypothetical protein FQA47_008420 [Oryzias melastigma]|uniref:Uncharacterized protein n=1 Tax=Oryzias melastigma TaxID=30732 RepID=A0A834FDX1_ORYME|nr:hypothetical protein FQA47_008420 [Oryzias melastigma]
MSLAPAPLPPVNSSFYLDSLKEILEHHPQHQPPVSTPHSPPLRHRLLITVHDLRTGPDRTGRKARSLGDVTLARSIFGYSLLRNSRDIPPGGVADREGSFSKLWVTPAHRHKLRRETGRNLHHASVRNRYRAIMTDGAAEVVVEDSGPAQSPLVSITFQRDVNWKKKYLEAEPKALGGHWSDSEEKLTGSSSLSLPNHFTILLNTQSHIRARGEPGFTPATCVLTDTHANFNCRNLLQVVIAGSVALSAQNLHLSTLKACLVMEIVASLASFCNIMMSLIENSWVDHKCWIFYEDKNSTSLLEVCLDLERVSTRFFAGSLLIHSALLAISITLVVYCCKVVKCCGPPPKVPMITVQTPPRHHDQETAQRSTHE